MENEVINAIHTLAEQENFDVKFIGYDKNCSLGKTLALPGRDIDALYMIIDDTGKPDWFAGAMRWKFKDIVNQRLVETPAGHLPEVLSTRFIEDGLELASYAFYLNEFQDEELKRFEKNLKDDSNDFVKSAEFNIRLAKTLSCDMATRDKFYKTAMLVELIREGVVLENNFSEDFINKIKKSPLYKYSNIIKMQGLSNKPKQKHIQRKSIIESFDRLSTKEQFSFIKEMIYSSLHIKASKHTSLFVNADLNGNDEIGNIAEMYDLLMNGK